jgi:hypothetical protein
MYCNWLAADDKASLASQHSGDKLHSSQKYLSVSGTLKQHTLLQHKAGRRQVVEHPS